MKSAFVSLAAGAIVFAAGMAPAAASSMPPADFGRSPVLGLGVGNGVSLSIDIPVSGDFSLGGAISAPRFASGNLDLRLMYKLLRGGRSTPWLDLLGGVQIYGPSWGQFNAYDPFIGVALAYAFTPRLTGRLNLALAFGTNLATSSTRASGLELGYQFTNNLEGTIGANGRGDFLGLKLNF